MAARKLLKLRRDDTCATCRSPLPAGTEAYWVKEERHVMCRSCGDLPQVESSTPGTSAEREHDRRRQARIDRRGSRFGRWIEETSRAPQHERAWAVGAAGERRNAARLEKLVEGQPVAFLHDRRVPGSRANIDHIAVGPTGVFVIDSKNAQGSVKVDWKGGLFSERRWFLYVAGRDRTAWVDAVERQVHVVRTVLDAADHPDVPVYGALCMANGEGLPWVGHPRLREIAICRPRHIAKRLSAEGQLTVGTIGSLHSLLEAALPPA